MSVTQRIERLCKACGEADFDDMAGEAGQAERVSRIFKAVRAGISDPAAVEADLDALDDAFADIGVDGLTTSARVYQKQEFDAGHPKVVALVCPLKACTRSEPPTDGQPAPSCTIAGVPLELLRTRA